MATLSSQVVAVGTRAGKFNRYYPTVADLLASTDSLTEGEIVEAENYRYEVAASDATNHALARANGTKLYVLPGDAGEINVGAFGATGNSSQDATSEIQAAVDYAGIFRKESPFPTRREGGVVFFPEGFYTITSTITSTEAVIIRGAGQRTIISGTIAGPIVYLQSAQKGLRGVEQICIQNLSTDPAAWCIFISGGVGGNIISQVFTIGLNGIKAITSLFSTKIQACTVNGTGADSGGIGILAGGHASVDTCDVTDHGKGIVIYGTGGVNILSCRLEANGAGIILGEDGAGSVSIARASGVIGCSLEANGIGIHARSFDGVITNCQINGTIYTPSEPQDSVYGILWESAGGALKESRVYSEYSKAAIRISGNPDLVTFENVTAQADDGATAWDFACDLKKIRLINCNNPSLDGTAKIYRYSDVDRLFGFRSGTGSATTTSASVNLDPLNGFNAGLYSVKSPSTSTLSGTLPAGTYYYRAAPVVEDGERGQAGTEVSATLSADGSITLVMNTISALASYRIWRGTSPGVYDGYFDHDGQGDFTDSGQAFDGTAAPNSAGIDFAPLAEPDTAYQVAVVPSWETTVWVTDKTTTGFTVNFGTAPSGASPFDWILMR